MRSSQQDCFRSRPGTLPAGFDIGMLKALAWIVGIIFLIGLLVVLGVLDFIL